MSMIRFSLGSLDPDLEDEKIDDREILRDKITQVS
jgi:hypothetical protein